ncbi:hypothetical protein C8F01DRAFT_1245626 [Mycena amicta]|nr:hypothetical protein C8F01DRAFT_1245626 [Mycena amicta]
MATIDPVLPRELERYIFEIAGQLYPTQIPLLLCVARRVHSWLKPLLFRVLRVSARMLAPLPLVMQSEPDFLRASVRYLCVDMDADEMMTAEQLDQLLAMCTLVIDLALVQYRFAPRSLPFLTKMQNLRRLSCSLERLFGDIDAIDSTHAIWSTITHLELMDHITRLNEDEQPRFWSTVGQIPLLTHLSCGNPSRLLWTSIQKLLEATPRLKMFVLVWSRYLVRQQFQYVNGTDVRDIRFMAGSYEHGDENMWLEWEQSATGVALDYWDRGEVFLERKKKGEVEANYLPFLPQQPVFPTHPAPVISDPPAEDEDEDEEIDDTEVSLYVARYPQRWAGRHLLLSSAVSSLGDGILGFSQGLTAVLQVQPAFVGRMFGSTHHFENGVNSVSVVQAAILICSISIPAIFTSFASAYSLERLGRRKTMRIGAVLFLLSAIIQASAPNLATLVGGRVVQGFGTDITSTSVPIFQVEIAPGGARGVMAGIEAFSMNTGYASAFFIGYLFFLKSTSDVAWRYSYIFQALICIFFIFWTFAISKSEGRRRSVNPDNDDVQRTYHAIIDTLELEMERFGDYGKLVGPWSRLYHSYPRRSRIGITARMFSHLSGINSILHFLPEHFAQAGFNAHSSVLYTGYCALFNYLGTIPAILFIDRLGRRRVLLGGSVMVSCALFLVGALQLYVDKWPAMLPFLGGPKGLFASMCIYLFCFGATAMAAETELFPLRMRPRGMAITTTSDWLVEIAVAVATPKLSDILSGYYYCVCRDGRRPLEAVGGTFGDPIPATLKSSHEMAMATDFFGRKKKHAAEGFFRRRRRILKADARSGPSEPSEPVGLVFVNGVQEEVVVGEPEAAACSREGGGPEGE